MKKTFLFVLTLCLLSSCRQQSGSLFEAAPLTNRYEPSYQSISLDSIPLDSINTSSFGESCLSPEGDIVYVDKYFCSVTLFDTLGHAKGTYLGYGGGPRETQIGRIAANTMLPDGRLLLVGYNLDVYLYKKALKEDGSMDGYEQEKVFVLQREEKEDWADNSFNYTNQYNDMVCRGYGDCYYVNVYSDHPDHLKLNDMEDYINRCRHLWEIDFKAGKEGRLLAAGYPQSYAEHPNTVFFGSCFDIDKEGNFYVNYEIDSLVYVYNHDFVPLQTYGYQGRDMNTSYQPIHDFKESRANYRKERNEKGWYYWIEYVDETRTLFRSYRKEDPAQDGLQVYRDGALLADVAVPKGFRVMGYRAPYYYSYVIPSMEAENTSMWMYRFRLP